MLVLESQLSAEFSAIYHLSVKIPAHSSAISKSERSQISAISQKRVVSQVTVKILTNSQLSVQIHPAPHFTHYHSL